jgi:hypothetical protein
LSTGCRFIEDTGLYDTGLYSISVQDMGLYRLPVWFIQDTGLYRIPVYTGYRFTGYRFIQDTGLYWMVTDDVACYAFIDIYFFIRN